MRFLILLWNKTRSNWLRRVRLAGTWIMSEQAGRFYIVTVLFTHNNDGAFCLCQQRSTDGLDERTNAGKDFPVWTYEQSPRL